MIDDLDQQLHRLQMHCRRNVDQLLAGHYRSIFKGRGLEFDDVRPYQSGDDPRSIDWNITARTGTTFIKRYHEERELCLIFVVDVSASMAYGTTARSKRDTVAEFCAHLAFTAQRNHDRVGLLLVSDHVELYLPPAPGTGAVMRLLRELLACTPTSTATKLSEALDYLANLRLRRSAIFVLSDFQDQGYAEALGMLAMRHDVVAVAVSDPREHQLPAVGVVRLRDHESGALCTIDTSADAIRAQHAAATRAAQAALALGLSEAGVDQLALSTDRPCIEDLLGFFHARERRVADETGG